MMNMRDFDYTQIGETSIHSFFCRTIHTIFRREYSPKTYTSLLLNAKPNGFREFIVLLALSVLRNMIFDGIFQ